MTSSAPTVEGRPVSPRPPPRRLGRFPPCARKAQHALSCVVRVIRCILGPTSVADKKTESGPSLVILGLSLSAINALRIRKGPFAQCVPWYRHHAGG